MCFETVVVEELSAVCECIRMNGIVAVLYQQTTSSELLPSITSHCIIWLGESKKDHNYYYYLNKFVRGEFIEVLYREWIFYIIYIYYKKHGCNFIKTSGKCASQSLVFLHPNFLQYRFLARRSLELELKLVSSFLKLAITQRTIWWDQLRSN